MSIPELEIRKYRPGDEGAILDTFNLVFREVCGAGYVDRTMAQWQWQYRDNPQGNRIWLAVAADGTVAAQYAGVPLLVDTPWGAKTFVHCVDSMTHPDWRQGLKRKGLFVLTCEPFWAAVCEKAAIDTNEGLSSTPTRAPGATPYQAMRSAKASLAASVTRCTKPAVPGTWCSSPA